ncbi:MAG TPA: hypothetical protein VFB13_17520 [Reyranella sp.]|jgi:hypothetical protein|nr:hypothetical protein [Reyranella sp.]
MPTASPQFDVAFSLTAPDSDFVRQLVGALPNHRSFFYQEQDRALTGASAAMGPMRRAFRSDTKLNVIVHRPPWGKAGYTKLEQDAIIDHYLTENALLPFLIRMDLSYPVPEWYPQHLVWCDRSKFSVEEIAAQIVDKLNRPTTPTVFNRSFDGLTHLITDDMRADIYKRVEAGKRRAIRKRLLETSDGFDLARAYMDELEEQIGLYAKRFQEIDSGFDVELARMGPAPFWFVISSSKRSVRIKWERDGGPSVKADRLIVDFCKDPASVPGKKQILGYWHGQGNDPRLASRKTYHAEITVSGAFGWMMRKEDIDYELYLREMFFDPEELAYQIVDEFHRQHSAQT